MPYALSGSNRRRRRRRRRGRRRRRRRRRETEWTAFQTHYFLENLVAPGIEPGTSGSVASNSDH
jgi:hypothetical protein